MQVDQPPKQQIVDRIKKASNILVTVNRSPDVDLLSAAIGLTMILEKLDKSAVAVFSGQIPRAIDFLEPDKVLEENVDSLRDFIIALDKEKADRLRYKVEGDVVRVYITPYKTTISEKDLKFSQGDFNVDLIIALGVEKNEDLDQALTAHGKIMHDAQIATITSDKQHSSIGDVDWSEPDASSYSEMIMGMSEALKTGLLDKSIATSLLTGLVSATDRFRNSKTTAKVMTMAAQLMAAGANQQLIAQELEKGGDEGSVSKTNSVDSNPAELSLRGAQPDQPEPETHAAADGPAVPGRAESQNPSESVMDDLAQETERINQPSAAPKDLALPPLPNTSTDSKAQGGWRDISTDRPEQLADDAIPPADPNNKVILGHEGSKVADVPTFNNSPINGTFGAGQEPQSVNTISGENTSQTSAENQQLVQTATPGLSFEMPPLPGDVQADAESSMGTSAGVPVVPVIAPVVEPSVQPGIALSEGTVVQQPVAPQQTPSPVPPQPVAAPSSQNSALENARATLDSLFGVPAASSATKPVAPPTAEPNPPQPIAPQPYMTVVPPAPVVPGLPMPDFSTLPPLPSELVGQPAAQPQTPQTPQVQQAQQISQVPQLGLPNQPIPSVATSNDPAQFRLPGQQ